jgi:nucleoside-diphosphate-sugar epimerase
MATRNRSLPAKTSRWILSRSPYASDKAAAEFYCRNFAALYGLETVVLRYFNVFGPRQSVNSGYAAVIPAFMDAAIVGAAPVIYGDGQQTRDFVYVRKVARANATAADTVTRNGTAINVATGIGTSLIELLEHVGEAAGRRLIPVFQPPRGGEVRHSRAEVTRAQELLNLHSEPTLAEGLRLTYEAYRQGAPTRT